MKLAAKIFTALAIALAISYAVASDYETEVSAAAGKIDVLNVGTCYGTDSAVFGEADCNDNVNDDDEYSLDDNPGTGSKSGIRNLKETARPFATYAVDPKTSAEEPRGILKDSDLIKISIFDEGRDKRTPVLLQAGGAQFDARTAEVDCYADGTNVYAVTPRGAAQDGLDREICTVYDLINTEHFSSAKKDGDELLKHDRAQFFYDRAVSGSDIATSKVEFTGSSSARRYVTVNVPDGAPDGEDYLPLHFELVERTKLSDDTVIGFYGYIIGAADATPLHGCTPITATEAGNIRTGIDPVGGGTETLSSKAPICNLERFIRFDEDIGSGRREGEPGLTGTQHVAPWISFGTSLRTGESVLIRYIYYRTSEREDLVGGVKSNEYEAHGTDTALAVEKRPVFTTDEQGATPDALVVEAVGDGVARTQHLHLTETARFSGRYEGYLRLTDANGDTVTTSGVDSDNWGRATKNAGASTEDGAAVLGVQGGPVTIRYRDAEGNVQTSRILIDTQPPLILVDTPAYKTNFDDERIRIAGSFSDADSGLRDDSFRLYVDNTDDRDEDGEDAGTPVLKLRVDGSVDTETSDTAAGYVVPKDGANSVVQLTEDYSGYDGPDDATDDPADGLFGVLDPNWIFKSLEKVEEGVRTDELLKLVDPDSYADQDKEATFDDVARLNIETNGRELNNQIDFQGMVLDIAGNVGFSDSDAAGPTFIHDYGTKQTDREPGRYNVLGWYARHIISIDQQDPRLWRSVTGFYGEDDDDAPIANGRGVMLLFDGAIDDDSISTSTFKVQLDAVTGADPADAVVSDVSVVGDTIYLLLAQALAPDATPKVSLNIGRTVRDPAGNALSSNDSLDGADGDREIESNDGIPPTLTVALTDGSATGTDGEGPTKLTKESIIVRITSDEDLQGAPYVTFLCEGFTWVDTMGNAIASDDVTHGVDDFVSNRRGKTSTASATGFQPATDVTGDCDTEDARLRPGATGTYSRPGNTWEYQWRNPLAREVSHVPDGDVTVVVYGRDQSPWSDKNEEDGSDAPINSYNWGAATAEFELDSVLGAPTNSQFGSVQPVEDSDVFESRPFVLLTFKDASTVGIDSFKVDGTAQEISSLGNNRFLYWPESLSFGKHKVEVEAADAAANTENFSYEFTVKQRSAFIVELLAGWNAVSVPAMPVNPAIDSVFTITQVDQVVGWDSNTPDAPWRIATKVDGVWTTNAEFAPLHTIEAGKGYWVHAGGFVDQAVMLSGVPDREDAASAPGGPVGISTIKGWNFVGVVDTDGDQTQDGDFGEKLMDSQNAEVTAGNYLRTFKQAYTWDPIKSQFNVIESGDAMEIGDGVWVYYADGFSLAP